LRDAGHTLSPARFGVVDPVSPDFPEHPLDAMVHDLVLAARTAVRRFVRLSALAATYGGCVALAPVRACMMARR